MASKGKFFNRNRKKALWRFLAYGVLLAGAYCLLDNAFFLMRSVRVNGQVTGWSRSATSNPSGSSPGYQVSMTYKTLSGEVRSGTYLTGRGFQGHPAVGDPVEVRYDPKATFRYHCGSAFLMILLPVLFMLAAGIFLNLTAPKLLQK